MNSEQVLSALRAGGLHPVRAETVSPLDDMPDLVMRGTLDDFIGAVKALEEKVVFVNVLILEETNFFYLVGSDGEEEPDLDEIDPSTDIIDLAEISADFNEYRKYLGCEYMFILSVYFKIHSLTYHIPEDWWTEFQSLRTSIAEEIEEQREGQREREPRDRKRGRNGRSGKQRPN
ncbi:MAG: hypothetical protein DMF61_25955 [Blastocatellia bacterium AA13]|nr:MAG: hypothetical protein DMF61_25955 [Blastocatellia bacterium AA13]